MGRTCWENTVAVCALVAPLLLGGCITLPPKQPADSASIDPSDAIVGVVRRIDASAVKHDITYALRSYVDKNSNRIVHRLYVTDSYNARYWSDYHRLLFEGRTDMRFRQIEAKKEDCGGPVCTYLEVFTGDISDADLRRRVDTGFDVRARANNGETFKLYVDPEMINQQLAAVDKAIRS